MSAIARYFLSRGAAVSGYDRTATALTQALEAEGAAICFTDDLEYLDKAADLVVYTPAIPATHKQLSWYRQQGYTVVKRSDVLGIITRGAFNICIAGTHGKTSISTMIAHLLRHTGLGCNAFLGGVSVNYNTNFWSSTSATCVVEADEYDRSFLKLWPNVAIITSMDADHLDIYGTHEAMQEAYVLFAKQLKPNGLLVRKAGLTPLDSLSATRQWHYELHPQTNAHIYAHNIRIAQGGYLFDAVINDVELPNIKLNVGGLHNIENMLAAMAVLVYMNAGAEAITEAVATYRGVKRRFEYILKPDTMDKHALVVIDDYAHHPDELDALLKSVRHLYPNEQITIVFQPHLYSRTQHHAAAFAQVLSQADHVILLPIYAAREAPVPGVSSQMIADEIEPGKVQVLDKEACVAYLNTIESGVLITAGAGDIDSLLPAITTNYQQKLHKQGLN